MLPTGFLLCGCRRRLGFEDHLLEFGQDCRVMLLQVGLDRQDFDRYPNLIDGLERVLCPRVHFKRVVVDGRTAYSGSANLTGAGMGAKSDHRRNFEAGFLSTDPNIVEVVMAQFDRIWMGAECEACGRKQHCAEYPELLAKTGTGATPWKP